MASFKKPPADAPGSTIVIGGNDEEDLVRTSTRQLGEGAEAPINDGATAFVRVDAVAPGPDAYGDGAGETMRESETAPEEPYVPPDDAVPEEEPAENGGATQMFNTRGKAPEPDQAEPEVERPKLKAPEEPAVEAYHPVAAPDYAGHLSGGPPRWKLWLKRTAAVALVLVFVGVVSLVLGYFYVIREVPHYETTRDYKPFVATQVVTSDGAVIGQFFREQRTVVKMDQIPRVLVNAVISAEDKDFYKHGGYNPLAMVRAVIVDLLAREKRLGASTITQQVVKNFFLTKEKKWKRKVKEILLAARLESNLSKDDILYLYLNQVNFGKAHYGVEQASLYYFNKHVQELDLGEAAVLAGLQQSPTRLNPRRHPENAKRRQLYVLGRMLANKYITKDDYEREAEKPLRLPPVPPEPPGAWYLEEVKRRLVEQFGQAPVETAGYTVEVAMSPKLQAAAEVAVQEGLRQLDKREGWHGPIFKLEPTQLGDFSTLIARQLAAASHGEAVLVADLADVPEKEQATTQLVARSAVLRSLEPNGLYAGVVTSVNAREARVQLAPGVEGPVPFGTMAWARPFKPEGRTPSPQSARDVLSQGDVVLVRIANVSFTRSGQTRKVARLELALEQTPMVQAGFAAIELKTRNVLALVGGYDNAKSQFNRATQAKRQPGSSFKPFLYAAALESGKYTPATRVDDSPEVITDPWSGKAWKPQNFERDEFAGPISLRKALAESKNTVAVKLLLDLGLDKVRAQALSAGLTSSIPQSYTAALGTGEVGVLEIINAYGTLASLGRKSDPIFIRKVTSREGSTLYKNESVPEPSMRADTAYLTADLLRSVIDDPDGTARSLGVIGRPVAGKTGTASEHRDGWFIGFTPSLVAGVWVGFDDHRMMGALETGGHCAGPIWLQFMRAATLGSSSEDFGPPPPGVVTVKINRNTGESAAPDDPFAVREVFMAGTEPKTSEAEPPPPPQEQFFQQQ